MKNRLKKILILSLSIFCLNSMGKRKLEEKVDINNKKPKFSLLQALDNELKVRVLEKNLETIIKDCENILDLEKLISKFFAQISLIDKNFKDLIDCHKDYLINISLRDHLTQDQKNILFRDAFMKSGSEKDEEKSVQKIIKLIKIGADPKLLLTNQDLDIGFDEYTLLEYIAKTGKLLKLTDFLIKQGFFNINDQDSAGVTALMIACENNNIEAIKLFLELGAEINLQNSNGNSALMFNLLSDEPNLDAIDLLLSSGADKNLKNNENINAVDYVNDLVNNDDLDQNIRDILN